MSMLERVRAAVLQLPLHRAADLELVSAAEGRAVIRYRVNDFTGNVQGMLHGGIVTAMHDVAVFLAVSTLLPADRHAVTCETQSSILRPANRGETIVVRAQVDRLGRTLAFMRSETWAVDGEGRERLIATGSLTKAVTPA
ncbi:MAG: PaaI family thioesterase [Pseudomonadota bacterium]